MDGETQTNRYDLNAHALWYATRATSPSAPIIACDPKPENRACKSEALMLKKHNARKFKTNITNIFITFKHKLS